MRRKEGIPAQLGVIADRAGPGPNAPAPKSSHIVFVRNANTVVVLSARDGSEVLSRPGTSYQACPQGGLLAIFSGDPAGHASIWDLGQKKEVLAFQGSGVAFDGSGKKVTTWEGQRQGLTIWDLANQRKLREFASLDGEAAFSPDGRRLAAHRGRLLVILDAETGGEILEIPEYAGTPIFSPDARKLACVGEKLTIRWADPPEPRPDIPGLVTPALARYGLTDRELTVLRLLAAGRTNPQIGAELYISASTASVHVSNILRKLGVSSRVQAAAVAGTDGLLASSPPAAGPAIRKSTDAAMTLSSCRMR